MNARFARFLLPGLALALVFLFSCSSTPAELVAKHTKRGDEFAQKEKYKEAVIEYKNAVKAGPNDAGLHFKLAKAALEAREFPTAFQELQKTVELDPNNFEAQTKLGEIYVAAGKTEEAVQIADNLVKSRPQDPAGYILKAGIAARAGKVDEAIAHLQKAVELDPKAIRPILTVGNLYLLKRDRKSAMEWYDKALAAAPDAPEVHVARGNLFFATGERDEGEKEYRKAIELSKEKENLRIALAEHYLYQGRMEDSEKELNAVIKEMNSQKARKVLAEIKLETGKPDEAKPLVEAIKRKREGPGRQVPEGEDRAFRETAGGRQGAVRGSDQAGRRHGARAPLQRSDRDPAGVRRRRDEGGPGSRQAGPEQRPGPAGPGRGLPEVERACRGRTGGGRGAAPESVQRAGGCFVRRLLPGA